MYAILQDFGLEVEQKETGGAGGYYIEGRQFELPELKILVDLVQSSKFITAKKSEELIRKISALTSAENARLLNREVFIKNRIKSENESIFYSVDAIHEAMNLDRQITFRYGELTPEKELVPKKGGALYQVSPWALTWDDENYYLIAYDEVAESIKHYRVDKMMKVNDVDERRIGGEKYRHFDLAEYARKTFGMYRGSDEKVVLNCANELAGVVIDRFGRDVMILKDGSDRFDVHVTVSVSPQFFGWITGIGPGMTIKSPENVREQYRDYLAEIAGNYQEL